MSSAQTPSTIGPNGSAVRTPRLSRIYERALALHGQGDIAQAEIRYREILAAEPDHPDALHMLGVVAVQNGQPQAGMALIRRSLRIDPNQAAAHSSLGNALRDLKQPQEALAHYARALQIDPDHTPSLNNRGSALLDLQRPQEALSSYERVLQLKPKHVGALVNRGNALLQLGRVDEAVDSYGKALRLAPSFVPALCARGNALLALHKYQDAHVDFSLAARLDPANVLALLGYGKALRALRRFDEALQALDRCLALNDLNAQVHHHRGGALLELRRMEEAVAAFESTLQIESDNPEAYYGLGIALGELGRQEEAAAAYARVLELAPGFPYTQGGLLQMKLQICDWADLAPQVMQLASAVQLGAPAIIPWPFLSIADTPALQLQCARSYALANFPAAASQPRRRAHAIHERIRIAYLSADFRDHPVAQLLAGIFEKHDRSRFEITAVSLRPADASSLGARVLTAVEHSVDVSRESDSAAAEALRKRHVDIAVDLQGFTHGMRTAILAHRAAPVQVNYLGYPGTMGAQYLDYLIADDVVIPREEEDHYTERIVRLPHSYLPFDNSQRIATRPSRAAAGLPAAGFVFCVFNNHYKITPVVFDIWMRLLRDVPDSILWLRPAGARTIANLRREAIARGVDAERLVIAPWVAGTEEHLARQQLADLFLDTLPYNAHATAIQALWSGVPVLTCRGTTFAGRVGASLLSAVGLPELIASDLREYEHTALRLARDPAALAAIRECLVAARTQRPLFDTETSCRDLERAFTWMVDRQRRGEPPTGVTFAPMR